VGGVGCVWCVGCVRGVEVWALWGCGVTPYVRHSPDCTCCDFGHLRFYYFLIYTPRAPIMDFDDTTPKDFWGHPLPGPAPFKFDPMTMSELMLRQVQAMIASFIFQHTILLYYRKTNLRNRAGLS
jgi:hypothetical protein